ncbi:hypothetical protein LR004_02670 [Candidatus Gracilibacteria bacterium]|nr:hypothetical protein [Candidatus Gracilibacteria bacterium]
MKKIILYILISVFTFIGTGISNQAQAAADEKIIYVTEKVPGAGCTKEESGNNVGMYKCTIKPGFSSIMQIMGKLLKYFTFIAGLLAVLMLVIGGIMYSMGGADEGMKTKSKEFITKSLLGLVLLLVSGSFLYAVAPWVYQ